MTRKERKFEDKEFRRLRKAKPKQQAEPVYWWTDPEFFHRIERTRSQSKRARRWAKHREKNNDPTGDQSQQAA
jgi:hypothetical protein